MSDLIFFVVVFCVSYIFISTIWTNARGAPWVPTRMKYVRRMLEIANVHSSETVYDLGAGDGRFLVSAVRHFGARAVGIELDPLRCMWLKLLVRLLRIHEKAQIICGDMFHQDLSQADVITFYLTPRANKRLAEKLSEELRPGTRVVSLIFELPGWTPDMVDTDNFIFLYRVTDKPAH